MVAADQRPHQQRDEHPEEAAGGGDRDPGRARGHRQVFAGELADRAHHDRLRERDQHLPGERPGERQTAEADQPPAATSTPPSRERRSKPAVQQRPGRNREHDVEQREDLREPADRADRDPVALGGAGGDRGVGQPQHLRRRREQPVGRDDAPRRAGSDPRRRGSLPARLAREIIAKRARHCAATPAPRSAGAGQLPIFSFLPRGPIRERGDGSSTGDAAAQANRGRRWAGSCVRCRRSSRAASRRSRSRGRGDRLAGTPRRDGARREPLGRHPRADDRHGRRDDQTHRGSRAAGLGASWPTHTAIFARRRPRPAAQPGHQRGRSDRTGHRGAARGLRTPPRRDRDAHRRGCSRAARRPRAASTSSSARACRPCRARAASASTSALSRRAARRCSRRRLGAAARDAAGAADEQRRAGHGALHADLQALGTRAPRTPAQRIAARCSASSRPATATTCCCARCSARIPAGTAFSLQRRRRPGCSHRALRGDPIRTRIAVAGPLVDAGRRAPSAGSLAADHDPAGRRAADAAGRHARRPGQTPRALRRRSSSRGAWPSARSPSGRSRRPRSASARPSRRPRSAWP